MTDERSVHVFMTEKPLAADRSYLCRRCAQLINRNHLHYACRVKQDSFTLCVPCGRTLLKTLKDRSAPHTPSTETS